jgi:GAF domain-containing protein
LPLLHEIAGSRHTAIYSGQIGAPFHLQAQSEGNGTVRLFPQKLTDSRVARLIAARHTPIQLDSVSMQSSVKNEWNFPHELQSWLFIPLLECTNLRGVLCLADDRPNGFSESAVRSMMAVTPQIAMALANISLRASVAASVAKYRTLIDNMHGVVFSCDRDWNIESVNAAAGISLSNRSTAES